MRSLTTRLAAPAAMAAVLLLTLGACGDDYDEDVVNALKATGATQEEAECVIDELGEGDAKKFVEAMDDESAPADAEKFIAALDECGVEAD